MQFARCRTVPGRRRYTWPRSGHSLAMNQNVAIVSSILGLVSASMLTGQADWSTAYPTPRPRAVHAATWDLTNNELVMFGGNTNNGYQGETHTWTAAGGWRRHSPAVEPSDRREHAMAYDIANGNVVLFGGWDGAPSNETWLWDGTSWSLAAPSNSPVGRWGPCHDVRPGLGHGDAPRRLRRQRRRVPRRHLAVERHRLAARDHAELTRPASRPRDRDRPRHDAARVPVRWLQRQHLVAGYVAVGWRRDELDSGRGDRAVDSVRARAGVRRFAVHVVRRGQPARCAPAQRHLGVRRYELGAADACQLTAEARGARARADRRRRLHPVRRLGQPVRTHG